MSRTSRHAKPGDLIEVEWWDSERVTLGWASEAEYREALEDRSLYRTAGYYVGETDDSLMVSHSRSDNGTYNDAMVIPRAVVKSRRAL